MTNTTPRNLRSLLSERYVDVPETLPRTADTQKLSSMLSRGSCRDFLDKPVPEPVIDLLCATALAAPTKSDLQQRDIIVLQAAEVRAALASLVGGQSWVSNAPLIIVFCGNNRRQRLIHDWRGTPFANDHLDAFFNAVGDAAIALSAFVTAAEAVGLGCCPISAVRNKAQKVSDLLALPSHVFPFAGLALGYPKGPTPISKRLPLKMTYHRDRYSEDGLRDAVEEYDIERAQAQPYTNQRLTNIFGTSSNYTWTEDKVRQYSQPERADFGAFIRAKGFSLD